MVETHTKASQISNPLVKVEGIEGNGKKTPLISFSLSLLQRTFFKKGGGGGQELKWLSAQLGVIKKARRDEKGWRGRGGAGSPAPRHCVCAITGGGRGEGGGQVVCVFGRGLRTLSDSEPCSAAHN